MKLSKANGRDKERNKRKHGMRVSGASVKFLLNLMITKAERIREEKKK